MSAIRDALNLDMVEVPFPGTPQVTVGVLGSRSKRVPPLQAVSWVPFGERALRPLVVGGLKRLAPIPDTPSLSEKGLKDGGLNLTLGLYAPRGTPARIIEPLQRALKVVAADPGVIAAIEKVGMFVQFDDGDTLRQQLEAEFKSVAHLGQKLKSTK